ncbi:MAG: hypothetical protein WBP02_19755 [Gammaproteobacteria bacterium]|jgi:hypothetical protein
MTHPVHAVHPHTTLYYWWPVLTLLSAAVIAGSDGLIDLPEHYRTPLSEVIYEEQSTWRAQPEDDNGWRTSDDELIHQGRLRKEILPDFDYEQRNDPTLRNTFMNENELARPKTNLFRLNF